MNPTAVMRAFEGDRQPQQTLQALTTTPCQNGSADIYPCRNIDLLSVVPLSVLGASAANDIWGWASGVREFALIGLNNGTAFVEVTDPAAPVYIGRLPTHTSNSSWRDIKVYQDHAFIVSEASGHGLQVFDLTRLLSADPAGAPYVLDDDGIYNGFGNAHNVAINEDNGFAYAVGTSTCSGGLHIVDIIVPNVPESPNPDGSPACYSGDGYTHDVQCVIYDGPDGTAAGREICFAANEDTLTIVDMTDKSAPRQLSRTGYAGRGYTHQVWLDEAHEYLFLDDELDESNYRHDTLTRVWNVSNLAAPQLIDEYYNAGVRAIDHNQYVHGDLVFQANYRSGLRVLQIVRDLDGRYTMLDEIGFFDIYPSSDAANFNGAWSTYPYLPSGNILISGIEQGLFVVALSAQDEIAIVDPANGDTVFGTTQIDIFAFDGSMGVPTVEWAIDAGLYQDARAVGSDIYTAEWNTTAAEEGWRHVSARMTDGQNNQSTTTISVLVNNQAPAVTFVSPDPSAGPVSGTVRLVAEADVDGSVVSATFFDGGQTIGTDTTPEDGLSVDWNTRRIAKGDHVLTVTATDNLGQTSHPEASITVTVGGSKDGGGGGSGGDDRCFKNKEPFCES